MEHAPLYRRWVQDAGRKIVHTRPPTQSEKRHPRVPLCLLRQTAGKTANRSCNLIFSIATSFDPPRYSVLNVRHWGFSGAKHDYVNSFFVVEGCKGDRNYQYIQVGDFRACILRRSELVLEEAMTFLYLSLRTEKLRFFSWELPFTEDVLMYVTSTSPAD